MPLIIYFSNNFFTAPKGGALQRTLRLTGIPAGRQMDGAFEAGSVFARVNQRLQELAETLVKFSPR